MYNFDIETAAELASILANNVQKRRLEKGLSRAALSRALGYSNEVKALLSEPKFSTIEELDIKL